MNDQFASKSEQLKNLLAVARRVTICLDGWTKKGLTASYLGISACFFDPSSDRPIHAFLSLMSIKHPHTGEKLANCLDECLKKWDISPEKVLLVVTDNGANIIKAVKLLQSQYDQSSDTVEDSEDDENESDEYDTDLDDGSEEAIDGEQDQDNMDLPEYVTFRRMQCMAHTLQLVVKPVFKHYETLITKTRHLVKKLRNSGPGVERLLEKCGKTVQKDCPTRWNSTHIMIKRLIEIKQPVTEVLAEIGKTQ